MNLIQHLVAFKAEVLGSELYNKINPLKIFMESFKFQTIGIFCSISHYLDLFLKDLNSWQLALK